MSNQFIIASISDLFKTNKDLLWATVVSALISTAISYWFKRGEIRHTAEIDYEYEQRKKLREVIGRFHGRLLSAANSMNYRLWNLYSNHDKGWLDVKGDYGVNRYYFLSCVYRFLNVFALIRQLERESILLDARIAQKSDFTFLNYSAALHWVMTDTALFDGVEYNHYQQRDHFFSDEFRRYCDFCFEDDEFIDFEEFKKGFSKKEELGTVFRYFDGLKPREDRLRWDRLVSFHLLLLAFINTFGYKRQYTKDQKFLKVARQIQNRQVLENLLEWLPRHDLANDREAKRIKKAFHAILCEN